jgi:hypothetical protein
MGPIPGGDAGPAWVVLPLLMVGRLEGLMIRVFVLATISRCRCSVPGSMLLLFFWLPVVVAVK